MNEDAKDKMKKTKLEFFPSLGTLAPSNIFTL